MKKSERVSILGYGRVGLALAKTLQQRGFSVSGTVTTSEKCEQLKAEGLMTSVLSFTPEPDGDLASVLNADILVVTVPPSRKSGVDFSAIMTNIAQAAAENPIQKVLLMSTTAVYPQMCGEVREEDARHDTPPFLGISWLSIEELFTGRTGFETTVVRFSGLMGGSINLGAYFSGREIRGATSPVNYIHIDDCVEIIAQIIGQEVWGEIFNASADVHPSKQDFYTKACMNADMPVPVFSQEKSPFRIVNSDKLKQSLDYTFQYPDPLTAL
ncbi:hypothetical protein CI610_01797 [invertebrate metagenome]|uniref:NAD(P)-binding domain-containing protein n=1 Tax=invertebrate metagenome TaxID=1711999 RepID=A0A2H9T7N0_9ZZZZ